MSNPQSNSPVLTDQMAADAFARLQADAVRPAFFFKLANDWNIHPQSQAECEQLESIAALASQHEASQQKQAAQGNPVLADIIGGLGAALQSNGPANASQHAESINKAASQLIADNPQLEAAAAIYAAASLQAAG